MQLVDVTLSIRQLSMQCSLIVITHLICIWTQRVERGGVSIFRAMFCSSTLCSYCTYAITDEWPSYVSIMKGNCCLCCSQSTVCTDVRENNAMVYGQEQCYVICIVDTRCLPLEGLSWQVWHILPCCRICCLNMHSSTYSNSNKAAEALLYTVFYTLSVSPHRIR